MKIKFEWENICSTATSATVGIIMFSSTSRAKVIGGWLVSDFVKILDNERSSIVFVPDPEHQWEI